jgi:cell division septum initiation protein DivIVA
VELRPAEIATRRFSWTPIGANPGEVRQFLAEAAATLERVNSELTQAIVDRTALQTALKEATTEVEDLRKRLAAAQQKVAAYQEQESLLARALLNAQKVTDDLIQQGKAQADRALAEANASADALTQSARRSAEELVRTSKAQAERTLAEANASAETLTQSARRSAEELVRTSKAQAERTLAEANATAQATLQAARRSAEEMLQTSKAQAERALTEANATAQAAQAAQKSAEEVLQTSKAQAERALTQASATAEATLQAAQKSAEEVLQTSKAEAEHALAEANATAEATAQSARKSAADLLRDARAQAEEAVQAAERTTEAKMAQVQMDTERLTEQARTAITGLQEAAVKQVGMLAANIEVVLSDRETLSRDLETLAKTHTESLKTVASLQAEVRNDILPALHKLLDTLKEGWNWSPPAAAPAPPVEPAFATQEPRPEEAGRPKPVPPAQEEGAPSHQVKGEFVVSPVHSYLQASRLVTAVSRVKGVQTARLRGYAGGVVTIDVITESGTLAGFDTSLIEEFPLSVVEATDNRMVLHIAKEPQRPDTG